MKTRSIAQAILTLCLLVGLLGITQSDREFARFRIGPLYILEFISLACILCFALLGKIREWFDIPFKNPFLIGYGLWGIGILAYQISTHAIPNEQISYSRAFQFCILFVYPLIWIPIGFVSYLINSRMVYAIVTIVLIWNVLPNFLGIKVLHLGMGPALAIPFLYVLHQTLNNKIEWANENVEYRIYLDTWKKRLVMFGVATFLGFYTFFPYWRMLLSQMQRTSLLMLILFCILIPFTVNYFRGGFLKSFRTAAIAIAFFIIGLPLTSYINRAQINQGFFPKAASPTPEASNSAENIAPGITASSVPNPKATNDTPNFLEITKKNILASIQKGEDVPMQQGDPIFQARTRTFMWKQAIDEFKSSPIAGIGFSSEMPKWAYPSHLNVGNWVRWGDPPVNGVHNSYLTVLARMGAVGLLLLLGLIATIGYRAVDLIRSPYFHFFDLFLVFIPLSGFLFAFFNVGLEGPHNAFPFWLFSGFLLGRHEAIRRHSLKEREIL